MKKETRIIVMIAACIVIVFSFMAFMFGGNKSETFCWVKFDEEITVKDGVADPVSFTQKIDISKKGDYQFELEWISGTGLVTGARFVDSEGEILFWLTGNCVDADMMSMSLDKGTYVMEYVNLLSAEDFSTFVLESSSGEHDGRTVYDASGEASDIGDYEFVKNGNFTNSYKYVIEEINKFNFWETSGLFAGIIFGCFFVVILLFVTKNNNKISPEYDERQEMIRGKGYYIGFWVTIIYFVALAFSDFVGIRIPAENSVIILAGILVGIFSMAIYCVWKDAYFAMNENRKSLYIVFLIVGFVNVALGIFNLHFGVAIVNGILTFRGINLICGSFLALFGVVLLIKNARKNEEDE